VHVAFWSPAWPLQKFQNGIITYVHWMKRELESQGHRVSVFTAERDATSQDPNVHLVGDNVGSGLTRAVNKHIRRRRQSYRGLFDFGAEIARAMKEVHRRDPIDIVEMEESFGWCADVARLTRLPLVVKLHGPAFTTMVKDELESPIGRERIEREGQALSRMESIVAPTELVLRRTLDKYGLKPRDARRIVNPVVMNDRTPLWSRSGCDTNCVLFVGRFDLVKGGDIVLKAFASAVRQQRSLSMIFVGPDNGVVGAGGDKLHFSEFCDSAIPADVRARVDFRGRLPNDAIMTLRTQSMLTVVASRWENQGYALLEAMFQGCPVVSTDAGGCPESVVDGVTGVLAKSEDVECFSQKILEVASDQARAEALGRAARQHVIREHNAKAVVEASLENYARVVGCGSSIE
jgi:glycosyltransferase involved in cell wall biosynthesis